MSPWESLLPVQLSTSNIMKPVSDLSQRLHDIKYRFLSTTHQSFWQSKFTCIFCQSRITPLCFSPCFFPGFFPGLFYSHCHFPRCVFQGFFHSIFPVFPTHPRTLSPQSALPQPFPSLFIQGLVSLVLCICLKIGLGRETLSSENNKSVRLIL